MNGCPQQPLLVKVHRHGVMAKVGGHAELWTGKKKKVAPEKEIDTDDLDGLVKDMAAYETFRRILKRME